MVCIDGALYSQTGQPAYRIGHHGLSNFQYRLSGFLVLGSPGPIFGRYPSSSSCSERNGQRESDWIFGWLPGDGFEPPDQRTNRSIIRIFSRVRDRADSLVGTIAETIGPQVSEALTLVAHPESRLAGSSQQFLLERKT